MKKGWIVAASLLFLLAIFTFGFSLFFLLLDSLSILITGLFSVPVYVSLYKNGLIGKKQVLFLDEAGGLILGSKLPVNLPELFVIFLERTVISLLIVCPLAHLIF